jgi:aryl carrier-like protein
MISANSNIIKVSSDGTVTIHKFPEGSICDQNAALRKLIGEDCDIFEHVMPRRLYTELKCSAEPDKKGPGKCVSMLCDEEFSFKAFEVNALASYLYETDRHGNPILGDVIFVGEALDSNNDIYFCGIDNVTFISLLAKVRNLAKDLTIFLTERRTAK